MTKRVKRRQVFVLCEQLIERRLQVWLPEGVCRRCWRVSVALGCRAHRCRGNRRGAQLCRCVQRQLGPTIEKAVQQALKGSSEVAEPRGDDTATRAGPGARRRVLAGPWRSPQRPLHRCPAGRLPDRGRVAWRECKHDRRPSPGREALGAVRRVDVRLHRRLSASAWPGMPTSWKRWLAAAAPLHALTSQLLAGEPAEVLGASAERANWSVPQTLTAVLLPAARSRGLAPQFGAENPAATEDLRAWNRPSRGR